MNILKRNILLKIGRLSDSSFITHFTPLVLTLVNISFFYSCKEDFTPNDSLQGQSINDCNEILGRPTDNSVTISILFDNKTDVYWEYGTSTGNYSSMTKSYVAEKDTPLEVDFAGLSVNTKYYYRTRYRQSGSSGDFLEGLEHSFQTQRAPGSTFVFTVEADPHPYDKKGCLNLWRITLKDQLSDNADFMIDLGDTFGNDHNPNTITSDDVRQLYLNNREIFGSACHSLPLFLCMGNHEGEKGYYLLQTPPNNLATYETIWRKYYYPNPEPNNFYTGNSANEGNDIGEPENYYSWIWGDALFVVMDVYRYATANDKPQNWDFTIGKNQYDWLKQTLESSVSKYKFVFAHHIRGEGRGGINTVKYFEWGGYEADGITYGFTSNRPGWAKPIHRLFVDNGVNIFFQGHDHLFSHETIDGMVYQEVPMPSDSLYQIGVLANADTYTTDVIDGAGYIRVTVSQTEITSEYVQSCLPADVTSNRLNKKVAFSYTIN